MSKIDIYNKFTPSTVIFWETFTDWKPIQIKKAILFYKNAANRMSTYPNKEQRDDIVRDIFKKIENMPNLIHYMPNMLPFENMRTTSMEDKLSQFVTSHSRDSVKGCRCYYDLDTYASPLSINGKTINRIYFPVASTVAYVQFNNYTESIRFRDLSINFQRLICAYIFDTEFEED